MTAETLRSLIDDALEGTISEADFLRLEAELSIDPVARREYYDRVFLSTLLEAEATARKVGTGEQARVMLTAVQSGGGGRPNLVALGG